MSDKTLKYFDSTVIEQAMDSWRKKSSEYIEGC